MHNLHVPSPLTEDGRDYIFSDNDEPGIVYIPQSIDLTRFPTGETHPVRVKPVFHKVTFQYQIDPDMPRADEEKVLFQTTDKTWGYEINIKDVKVSENNWVKLQFPTPPPGSYVNLIQYHGDDEEPHCIFLNISEKELT